ncbi:MAG: outer membrane protein assembly factor BamB [Verrucomicrobiales bacterium]|jgi:outer membrane protein assembly factor BamB
MKLTVHHLFLLMSSVCCQFSVAVPGDIMDTFATGGPIYASPTLSPDGTIYLGANDANCYAIQPMADGLAGKWTYTADDWIDSSVAIGPDGTLYVATYDSTLIALHPDTGIEKWSVTVGAEDNAVGVIRSSPAIAEDGAIIVTTNAGFVHALNTLGEQLWSFEIGSESRSSAAIDTNGNIYFGAADGKLYCLNSAGQMQWAYAVDDAGTDTSRLYSSPAIDGDGHIYVGSGNGFLYSLTAAGALRWKYETPEAVDSSPAIDQSNRIYFGSRNGSIYCLDQSGSLEWSAFLGDIFYSSPVIDANGYVYATYFGGQGTSFVIAFAPGGVEAWQTRIDAIIDSSIAIAPDGTLYVGGFDGNVYAIEGSGSGLGYECAWPRFRKDSRSRGRMREGAMPSIWTALQPVLAPLGGKAEFSIDASGSGEVSYHWRRNGVLIEGNDLSSLLISEVSGDAVGIYDLILSNGFGEVLTKPVYLANYTPPVYRIENESFEFITQIRHPQSAELGPIRIESSADLLNWAQDGVSTETVSSGDGIADIKATIKSNLSAGFLRLQTGN